MQFKTLKWTRITEGAKDVAEERDVHIVDNSSTEKHSLESDKIMVDLNSKYKKMMIPINRCAKICGSLQQNEKLSFHCLERIIISLFWFTKRRYNYKCTGWRHQTKEKNSSTSNSCR